MDKKNVKNMVKDVISLLIKEGLLEINEEEGITEEAYKKAIDTIKDTSFNKLGKKWDKSLPKDTEKLLKEKMEQGYNLNIECKGKGRTYEMTFEGLADEVGKTCLDNLTDLAKYHGVGDTIEELLDCMFNKRGIDKYQKAKKKYINEEE